MGVPVVARYGESRAARSTSTIVTNVGYPQWNATTDKSYIDCVRQLASDPNQLQQIRTSLRPRLTKTIANAKRFTGELERVYRSLWSQWCNEN